MKMSTKARQLTLTAAAGLATAACQDTAPPTGVPAGRPPAASARVAAGAETQCVGTLPPGVYESLVVPPDADCVVIASEVRGDVTALENARLVLTETRVGGSIFGERARSVQAFRRNTVGRNIEVRASGPFDIGPEVILCGNTLPNGSIVVSGTTGWVDVGTSQFIGDCPGNTLPRGDIVVEGNVAQGSDQLGVNGNNVAGSVHVLGNSVDPLSGSQLGVFANTIGGNLHVFRTTGDGQKLVIGNTVANKLHCKDNTPFFLGTPNQARTAKGQCAPDGIAE